MTIGERHPVTKDYQAGDTIHLDEIGLIIDRMYIDSFNPGDYVDLLYETSDPVNALAFGLDNSARKGGRIVQIHGNYTVAPTWYTLMVDEAVDWLAPRPKGRILVDLSHSPWIALDPWDDWEEAYYLNQWRNGLVNRSYTVDKLATSLSADNLVGYDMLVVLAPIDNFTSPELTYVRNWVEAGGGLLAIGDHPTLAPVDMNLNYLLSPYNIQFSLGAGGTFDTYATPVLVHPTLEDTMWMEYDSFAYLNITGDAFPLWMDDANIACAGQEYGIGRIVVVPDLNLFTDTLGITNYDNFRFLMNVANWLTTATARVLLLNDEFISPDRNRVAPALALNTLGINYYITHDSAWLNVSLYDYWDNWDLVIADVPGGSLNGYFDDLQAYVEAGGKLIISYYQMNSYAGSPLWPFLGVLPVAYAGDQPDVYIWVSDSPVFNIPAEYGADLFRPTEDYGSEGSYLHVFSNATSLAGFSSSPTTNETVIALRNDGRALVNAFLIDEFQGDHDNSTYMDSYELWMDEIALLYFERPTIDHPADVTYVEGETGNSIVWTPNAPAGPWRYVLRVNGSIDAVVLWDGSPINVSIDGVDVSVTTYELTVYDDLGYYVSDSVMLDVTAYVPPPGLNPLLLVAIGAGAVILVVVVLMVTKRGKKE